MAHFTKGPWEIASYRNYFGFSVGSPHGPCIAERWYQHERTPEQNEEMIANARLIAAAPELLEQFQALVGLLDESDEHEIEDSTLDECRAVIAKAEGK